MNRRLRNPNGSGSKPKSDRFLKPGALARIRDSKISARSPSRSAVKIQILSPPPSPARSVATVDGSPCFVGRIYGPRFLNRKKLVASKRIFFVPSSPDPVSESGLDVIGADLLLAH
ncbi:uncharacterized protein A4U43_C03F11970 [Asparagus officinalis]|uniref:Uncharacterized protein n=1 Tax=Asparagus officinalis TaxID=4686 RepID=A0A5P1FEI6_ASPOF|nr:uncharacterized protein A4U43_C03F11970 [Asparagus officinalis]